MAKILKFPEKSEEQVWSWYSQSIVDVLMESQEKKSFRYGLSVGLVSGAAFTLAGFVLAFLFR